ncbi:MAG: 4Fe-4S dicluster domain-containing protein [Clostridia bacterium]|nr:4Fe-4S dicluster domain-containing protein [Clostridia bacterium]
MYRKVKMFFYSGTGNTFKIAKWFSELAAEKKMKTEFIPMNSAKSLKLEEKDQDSLLGILFPIHALTAPLSVIKFALSLPEGKGQECFILANRGGGSFLKTDPGCEGSGTYLIAVIMKLKGYRVKGVSAIDMPANWNALHPSYREATINFILDRGRKKTRDFAEQALNGRSVYKGFIPFTIGVVFLPVSIAYIFVGRLILAKMFFANYKCNHCGVCEKICPNKAIKLKGRKSPMPYWSFSCESCMRCIAYCPQKAIEFQQALFILMIYIFSLPLAGWIVKPMTEFFGSGGVSGLFSCLLQLLSGIGVAFLLQWMLNVAVRNPVLNRFFTFTTLTHVFKRYHEPSTSCNDLTKRN